MPSGTNQGGGITTKRKKEKKRVASGGRGGDLQHDESLSVSDLRRSKINKREIELRPKEGEGRGRKRSQSRKERVAFDPYPAMVIKTSSGDSDPKRRGKTGEGLESAFLGRLPPSKRGGRVFL